MADNDHILSTESTPLNTTLEPNATDATTEAVSASTDHSSNPASETVPTPEAVQHDTPVASPFGETAQHGAADPIPAISAASDEAEPEYDAEDFAKALESFDREQAAEKESAQSLTAEEVVVTGTVVKITDKHVVVDIGLKSEGLIPLDQVLDHTGTPKFKVGDTVEVVVEREENEGGYLAVSYTHLTLPTIYSV